jgi:hypothetical protein
MKVLEPGMHTTCTSTRIAGVIGLRSPVWADPLDLVRANASTVVILRLDFEMGVCTFSSDLSYGS